MPYIAKTVKTLPNQISRMHPIASGVPSANMLDGDLSMYLKAPIRKRDSQTLNQGHAGYAAIDYSLGDMITLSALHLTDFVQNGQRREIKGQAGDFRYNQPPTLERIDQETSKGIDERAGRLMLEYTMLDGDFTLASNAMFKQEFPTPSQLTTLHTYVKLEIFHGGGRSRFAVSRYRDLKQPATVKVRALRK